MRALFALLLVGCLPEDTRPPPGLVNVTFRGADATIDGFTTSDGWNVKLDRVLVSIGSADVEGPGCTEYADADYFRILDGRLRTPQKVGLIYGLGTCTFELRARNPESDSLLGTGVSESDKLAMRDPGSNAYDEFAGITFWVTGNAERSGVRKTFDWKYRRRRIAYEDCLVDGASKEFTLRANQEVTVEVRVHASALFQDALDRDKAKLRFDPIATADGNGDGVVTLEELDEVTMEGVGIERPEDEQAKDWVTLGEFVYHGLFPRMIRVFETGTCGLRGGPPRM
jgi:hypothetical protein